MLKYFFILSLLLTSLYGLPAVSPEISSKSTAEHPVNQTDIVNPPENMLSKTTSDSIFSRIVEGGFLMIPIMLMAFIGLVIIFERLIVYTREKYWFTNSVEQYLQNKDSVSQSMYEEEALDEFQSELDYYAMKMEKGMNILNAVGNLAPLVGFFGTVVGMVSAFSAIANATTVNAKVVAEGIQIALITTAGGLSVAVPALSFFHLFQHFIIKAENTGGRLIRELAGKRPALIHEHTNKT